MPDYDLIACFLFYGLLHWLSFVEPKKRYPPSPTDEVWRLKNIAKDGPFHECLVEKKILTVQDFLVEFQKNCERLRDVRIINL